MFFGSCSEGTALPLPRRKTMEHGRGLPRDCPPYPTCPQGCTVPRANSRRAYFPVKFGPSNPVVFIILFPL